MKEKETAIKFANFIAKYGIVPSINEKGQTKKNKWWFNQQNGTNPEKTSEELFELAAKMKFK